MPEKLCVFISYKREDQAVAEKLWETLRAWGYDTWLDIKNIQSGISPQSSTWIDAIHKGLKRSQILIGIVTPESLRSQNVKDEWYWAREANRRILLLRLRSFDPEEMPPPFIATDYIDLVRDEPQGFARLQRELERVARERDELKGEFTLPEPTAPATIQPKPLPAYLIEKPAPRRYVPWRLTLRIVGVLALPISFLWLLTQPDFEPLLAFLGALGSIIASFVGVVNSGADINRFSKLTDYEQMRKRVYQYWVQGVMQTALKEVESVGIALDMQPEAVVRDARRNVGDIDLPNGSRHVRHVYDVFKSFLILGEPGAGKTIMLLQLAESLILDPPQTHKNAIPLVLNLSSWSLKPAPLADWLENEVWRTYRVRGSRVRGWLQNNQLLLLLDGLDEVGDVNDIKEEKRAACIEAINAFRQAYPYVPMVVCSRSKDYAHLGETKLELPGAFLLEALSQEQIDHYLSDPQLAHLKRVIADDAVLQAMATTPFLLNTMIYAYRHEEEAALRGFETEAARHEHLFNTYVQRRLADNPSPYPYQQTVGHLRWLATKMQAYVQTVFHLEDIQPDWLADDPYYHPIVTVLRVCYAVILTILYALVGWQMSGVIGVFAWGTCGALVGGSIAALQPFRLRRRDEIINFGSDSLLTYGLILLLIYLVLMTTIGLMLLEGLRSYMAETLAIVLVSAVVGALPLLLLFRNDLGSRSTFAVVSVVTMIFSLVFIGFVWSISRALPWTIWIEACLVAISAVYILLHVFVFAAQQAANLPRARSSLRRVLLGSSLAGIVFGWLGVWLNLNLVLGVTAALTYAGLFNGLSLIDMLVVWVRLRQRSSLPKRAQRFLDAMVERQILRPMGGGYIFIHRYLLEHFADVDHVFVLIEQLLAKDQKTRDKAAAALINVGQPVVRTLHETLNTKQLSPNQKSWLYLALDALQPRSGIGVRSEGLNKDLPDIDWVLVPDDGEWVYQDSKYPPLSAFRISRYPITYAQFQAFLDAPDGIDDDRWWEGMPKQIRKRPMEQELKYSNHPRENVTWYQAVAFCRWLSAKLDEEVMLPTEQQWEKAARGTDGREYPWGEEYIPGYANVCETKNGVGPYYGMQTSVVGIYLQGASPYGVLDMSGNVWEWCANKYDDPTQVAVDVSGEERVLRGGSWDYSAGDARCAVRSGDDPKLARWDVGFRVVCASPASPSEL